MLIVVHHRDIEFFDQPPFNLEAARRADVLEIDAAEDRRDPFDRRDDFVDVFGVQANWECVDSGELPEEHTLPSITGAAPYGPMSPKPSTAVPSLTTAIELRLIVNW